MERSAVMKRGNRGATTTRCVCFMMIGKGDKTGGDVKEPLFL